MDAWNTLTAALDELDAISAQVRRGRARQRATSFFQLVQPYTSGQRDSDDADMGHIANVIQLDDGFCLVHWLREPKSLGIYSSILTLRRALCWDGVLLVISNTSAQLTGPHPSVTPLLTPTERELALLLGHGLSNKEIGVQMNLSVNTIKNTSSNLYAKLKVSDRTQAALLVRDLGLDTPNIDHSDAPPPPVDARPRPARKLGLGTRLPSRAVDRAAAWRNEYRPPVDSAPADE